MITRPRVFTIPASAPFLPVLIESLLDGRLVPGVAAGGDPMALADVTLYLPTRRACRLARRAFLDIGGHDAAILPRILPIGEVDEDELAFAEAASGGLGEAALDLPPSLGGLERLLMLARLTRRWSASAGLAAASGAPLVAQSPAAALSLASDLARLMDDMTTRQVPWDALDTLVPEEHDRYWQLTLDFLKVARTHWPAHLAEFGAMEPAERRDRLIEAECRRLASRSAPVIAAGSTGSMPATAKLLATVAGLAHGAVVLPGLDTDLDAPSWATIDDDGGDGPHGGPAFSHPQLAMHALLKRLGLDRESVAPLAPPAVHGRERLVSEALRPAVTTALWSQRLTVDGFDAHADTAMAGVSIITAPHAEDESLAIAVALREVLETPGKTAALVTPDRALARRVIAALDRWQVAVDDSGGDVLADTAEGVLARLAIQVGLGGLEPVPLLALLKHPLAGFDGKGVAALERAVLRGPRPRPGTAGLDLALRTLRATRDTLHGNDPRRALGDSELDDAAAVVARLEALLAPLESMADEPAEVADFAARHREALAGLDGLTEELGDTFAILEATRDFVIEPVDYPELFHFTLAQRTVRRPEIDVRVRIFGPLESRLQTVDRVVLGGLVEGVWPPDARPDPWLSRPMRKALGLDLPERRIGLSAHDFAQALGARELVLSWPAKLGGAPTVPSRFVQRLSTVAGPARWSEAQRRGSRYLEWALELDRVVRRETIARPAPTPPVRSRPVRLSVTEIEHWLRDPYTIYARHVLRLRPLDAVDEPPGAADRGTVIHEAVGEFARTYASALPNDPIGELERIGAKHFAGLDDFPEARAFWWPRYLRIARWFADFEKRRRAAIVELHTEIRGELTIPLGERTFTLSTRADRIERRDNGSYAILDYKTGTPPTEKQVSAGLAPQLTLEAAILRRGGFGGIAAGVSVSELTYVALRGGNPPGKDKPIQFKDGTPDEQADRALERLHGVAARFEQPDTPYPSLQRPMWVGRRYGDYDHLARVKEWSLTGGADDGDAP